MAQRMLGGMKMEFGMERIRPGMEVVITRVAPGHPMRGRLRQFGMVPGTRVWCRCGEGLLALELLGTVIGIRRRDLAGIFARVTA